MICEQFRIIAVCTLSSHFIFPITMERWAASNQRAVVSQVLPGGSLALRHQQDCTTADTPPHTETFKDGGSQQWVASNQRLVAR